MTTRIPCRFLDLHSRQCRVYEQRFNVGEDCQKLTPQLVAEVDWLPEECAYVQWHKQQCATPVSNKTGVAQGKFKRRI
nr:YkgJ family cysteine cluster protein [uncultured Desulfuromonas sp.]